MAESITYADLRFVKSPLKKNLSAQPEPDPEVDEDGELTYENVQVPSSKDVLPSPAQPGLGRQTGGVKTEKQAIAGYSVASPIARKILLCPVAWTPYILLSLLGICLLLGVTTVSLGIQYMQMSQHLSNINQLLEVTNGSLRQQLQMKVIQLSRKEEDLQAVRKELVQTQHNLQVEKQQHQKIEENLLTCKEEWNKTNLTLENEVEGKRNLEEKLKSLQNTLMQVQSLSSCSLTGHEGEHSLLLPKLCCPLGWMLYQRKCLYISYLKKTWSESKKSCSSQNSKLFTSKSWAEKSSLLKFLTEYPRDGFWIQVESRKFNEKEYSMDCPYLTRYYDDYTSCRLILYFICEKEAITYSDELEKHSLH